MTNQLSLRAGDVVADRYQLVEEIGRGGFGVVYRATQLGLGRDVAVKILYPPRDAEQSRQMALRFQREALMVRDLQHPHTIRQYDYGQTDDGLMYFVMEFLRGKTLEKILRDEGPLTEERVMNVARGALKSLAEAHAFNIVHRDLKPANIMLCDIYGESDFVKILDFGIAKTTMGKHDITSQGMTVGSPRYMAPELLRGESPLPASDLYSLGLTLGESLLGHPVITAENSVQCARLQLSPQPLEVPSRLQGSWLWPWLSRALDKDLSRRFTTAEEMLAALDAQQPVVGAPRSEPSAAVSPRAEGHHVGSGMLQLGDPSAAPPSAATVLIESSSVAFDGVDEEAYQATVQMDAPPAHMFERPPARDVSMQNQLMSRPPAEPGFGHDDAPSTDAPAGPSAQAQGGPGGTNHRPIIVGIIVAVIALVLLAGAAAYLLLTR